LKKKQVKMNVVKIHKQAPPPSMGSPLCLFQFVVWCYHHGKGVELVPVLLILFCHNGGGGMPNVGGKFLMKIVFFPEVFKVTTEKLPKVRYYIRF
jgi:hypothetical protein